MESERINIVISPEILNRDLFNINYDGNTFGIYSGMTQILSGGETGGSLLTGLTIPILFTETFNDLGFYDEFDGFIDQADTVNNFIFSGDANLWLVDKLINCKRNGLVKNNIVCFPVKRCFILVHVK